MLLLNVSPYFVMALGFVQRYRKTPASAPSRRTPSPSPSQ
jgi:hypothetical protein